MSSSYILVFQWNESAYLVSTFVVGQTFTTLLQISESSQPSTSFFSYRFSYNLFSVFPPLSSCFRHVYNCKNCESLFWHQTRPLHAVFPVMQSAKFYERLPTLNMEVKFYLFWAVAFLDCYSQNWSKWRLAMLKCGRRQTEVRDSRHWWFRAGTTPRRWSIFTTDLWMESLLAVISFQ